MTKEILFSVTANDCRWSYTKGSGPGGQKKNKTSSAVHCFHDPSGSHGYSEASRSQLENKVDAFTKMVETDKFKKWRYLETLRKNGKMAEIDSYVEKQMKLVKVEHKVEGIWVDEKVVPLT